MIPGWLRRHRELPQEAPPLPGKRRRFGGAADIDEFAGELRGIEDHVLADLDVPPPALVAEILKGIAESERGETADLGTFAAYCEDGEGMP